MAAPRGTPERPSRIEEVKLLQKQQAIRAGVGASLQRARIEANLSLRGICRQANASPSYWSEVERGQRSPTTDFLVRACYFLNVPITALFDQM